MSKKPTIQEIKKKLDDKKIEYKNNMKQDELLDLLNKEQKKQENSTESVESKVGNDEEKQESDVAEDSGGEHQEEQAKEKPKQYVVLHDFKDLQDRDIVYIKDEIYPKRADSDISEERIQELMSDQNKIGKPLIKEQG